MTRAAKGMTVSLKCTGPGCARALRNGKGIKVKKAGKVNLVSFVRKSRLRRGALLEIRALETDAISLVERFTMRRAEAPKHLQRPRARVEEALAVPGMSYGLHVTFHALPGRGADLEQLLRDAVVELGDVPCLELLRIERSPDEPHVVRVTEGWTSRAGTRSSPGGRTSAT